MLTDDIEGQNVNPHHFLCKGKCAFNIYIYTVQKWVHAIHKILWSTFYHFMLTSVPSQ